MDSESHVWLAQRLLVVGAGDQAALPVALFPQVDRTPAYLHRMYAHPFFQFGPMFSAASDVYWGASVVPHEDRTVAEDYFCTRLEEDRARIEGHVTRVVATGIGLTVPDRRSAALAFASHAYQDVFNNPIQAFLPYHPFPSGAWDLWQEVGSLDFRQKLYLTGNIQGVRDDLFSRDEWSARLSIVALTEALVRRAAAYCVRAVSETVISQACDRLGVATAGANDGGVSSAC